LALSSSQPHQADFSLSVFQPLLLKFLRKETLSSDKNQRETLSSLKETPLARDNNPSFLENFKNQANHNSFSISATSPFVQHLSSF